MKYPVDIEKFIAAMRLEFGPDPAAEENFCVIIPCLNAAYEDGLHGKGGYPLDPEETLSAFAEDQGDPLEVIQDNPLLPELVAWVNRAYAQGRQNATEE